MTWVAAALGVRASARIVTWLPALSGSVVSTFSVWSSPACRRRVRVAMQPSVLAGLRGEGEVRVGSQVAQRALFDAADLAREDAQAARGLLERGRSVAAE